MQAAGRLKGSTNEDIESRAPPAGGGICILGPNKNMGTLLV